MFMVAEPVARRCCGGEGRVSRAGSGAKRELSVDPANVRDRERRELARALRRHVHDIGEDADYIGRRLGVDFYRATGLMNGVIFPTETEIIAIKRLLGIA